jgi:hypothetical protein
VLEDFEGTSIWVAERRFAAKDMIFAPGDPDDRLALTTGVTLAYKRLETGRNSANAPGPRDTGDVPAGRAAALLLLSYYLPAVVWALKRGKRKYLLYSAPIATTLWATLR